MPIKIIKGNIFTSKAMTIVNTVNCVGVMGAGIALECRLRYPEMYLKYINLCENKKLDIGMLWIYKIEDRWILNFPTKKDWKLPSKVSYLKMGLEKFQQTYKEKGISSIAFPLLGADKGGLNADQSLEIMVSYLDDLPIDIEIYKYDESAKDDLFDKTKHWLLSNDLNSLSKLTNIRPQYLEKVLNAIETENINQLNQLARVKGVGINTLEKLFRASIEPANQSSLF